MGQGNQSGRRDEQVHSLADLLRLRREAAGLSQAQLATELGVSRPYLTRLEHGTYSHPSLKILIRMVNRLSIPIEDLYALTGILLPTDLPNFGSYLRTKHPEWPEQVVTELVDFYNFVRDKYSLN
jgi:transcriptional regulator with XRE-family HTH domain